MRQRRTRAEVKEMILRRVRELPGGKYIRDIQIEPMTDDSPVPPFFVDVEEDADDDLNVALRATDIAIRIMYCIFDVEDFAEH
ncbi:hypothetical protein Mnod_5798 [Methylobacterium nodulans ORS 2060]|uniref:Uncharacterized protein n=2 Tax=Methylobacterium nodulans TaxID=114616 RepID=B8IRS7_METNO|nr:hypothetical protein Mnod_5798 [Methylobacterium nodulans ORS 2060]